jgi:enoyl-[acyl-carrier-protein] reductase (NADH)
MSCRIVGRRADSRLRSWYNHNDDVGAATAFLALDGAKLITGGVMYIDGGYHIID